MKDRSRFFFLKPRVNVTHLVAGEDQCVSNNHIFPAASGENDNLGDIVSCQRFNSPGFSRLVPHLVVDVLSVVTHL